MPNTLDRIVFSENNSDNIYYLSNSVNGYLNTTDNKFYKESTFITRLHGISTLVYIDLNTNNLYRYDETNSTYVQLIPLPTFGSVITKDIPTNGNASVNQVVMGNDSRLTDSRNAADVSAWAKAPNKPNYTAAEVGALPSSLKGAANGIAELDSNGKVPSTQLPSYVDDILEFSDINNLPLEGESGKIYVTINNNKSYRWSGSGYTEISSSLSLGETSSTAYAGDKGKANADAISALQSNKVDKVTGKGLSTNDYNATAKNKLEGLADIKSIGSGLSLNDITGELTLAAQEEQEIISYKIITKSTSPSEAGLTIEKYSNNELQSSTDYKFDAFLTPVDFDGYMTIVYDTSFYQYNYTLTKPSDEHSLGYNFSWNYQTEVNIEEVFSNNNDNNVKNIVTIGLTNNNDYICDGVADNVEFQLAIDEINAKGGGIILVREGNYTFNTAIHPKSNVEIRMTENTVITMNNQQSWTLPQITTQNTNIVSVNDEILEYVTIGQAVGFTNGKTGYITDEEQGSWNFITEIDSTNKTITLYNNLLYSYSTMVTLDSIISIIEWLDGYTHNITIKGGVLDGNKTNQLVWIADMTHNGILIGECSYLSIEGVTVRNVCFQGIHIVIRSRFLQEQYGVMTTIKNCYVYNTNAGGICIDSSRFVLIKGCMIDNCGFGVQVVESRNIYIDDCSTVRTNGGVHITGQQTNNIIIDKHISNNDTIGIHINGVNNCIINNGIIQNNETAGIQLSDNANFNILNNLIIKNNTTGIYETNGCLNNIANSIIMNNNISNYRISTMKIGGEQSNIILEKISNSLMYVKDKNNTILGGIEPDSSLIDTSINLFDLSSVNWELHLGYGYATSLSLKPETQYTIWGEAPISDPLTNQSQTLYFGDLETSVESLGGVKTITTDSTGEVWIWVIAGRDSEPSYRDGTYKITVVEGTEPFKYYANNIISKHSGINPAPDFDETITYAVGDYVVYNNNTYMFTSSKTAGAWDSSKVIAIYSMGAYVTAGKKVNTTLGAYATAEGKNTTASGEVSHAEGSYTIASGIYSHAEGAFTSASGDYSHAEGAFTSASGDYSHAEGEYTSASGDLSHAEGRSTQTGADYQHVQGLYNVGKATTLFEIGNGTADNARSNAFEVDTNGNIVAGGTITDGNGNTVGPQGVIPVDPSDTSGLNIWIET